MMTTKFLIGVEASCMHCRVMNVNDFSKELKHTIVAYVNRSKMTTAGVEPAIS
jgi:nicotinamide mononucleotide (NMN) deamidase PncC